MMRWLVAVALLILMAGCSSPPQAAPIDEPSTTSATTVPTPVLVMTEEPIDWSATIGTCIYFHVQVDGCPVTGLPPATDPTNAASSPSPRYIHATHGRTLTSGHLVLDWQAQSAATTVLRMIVITQTGCPDHCIGDRPLGIVEGPSPLTLDLSSAGFGTDESIVARIEVGNITSGLAVSPGQNIHLSGPLDFVSTLTAMADSLR